MRRDCNTCKHGDEPLNGPACGNCTMFDKYEEDDMGEKTFAMTFKADKINEEVLKDITGQTESREDDDLQAKLDEAHEYIDELDRRLRAEQIELAAMRGMIDGLKFAIRCNGVSGGEVH